MKLTTLLPAAAGMAAGYLAGAAAGRGRYRQIVAAATKLVQHPKVQQFVFDLAGQAKANSHRLPGPAVKVVNNAATRIQDALTEPDDSATAAPSPAAEQPTSQPGPTTP